MALDKSIPCWVGTNHKPRRIDGSVDQFDLALACVVRGAGGHISVVEAYRQLSHPTERNCRKLTVEGFLRMLRSVERIVIEFKDPQSPIIRLRPSNAEVFLRDVPTQNGKSSTARKVHSIYQRFRFLAQSTAPANAAQSQGAKLGSILFCNAAAVLLLNEAEFENATPAKHN